MKNTHHILMNGFFLPLIFAMMIATAVAGQVGHVPNPEQPTDEEIALITKAAPSKAPAKPAQPRRLLVFWRCETYFHKSIPYGNAAFRIMGEKTKAYETVISDNMAVLDSKYLEQFDGLLFNNTTELVLTDSQKKAILDFVNSGKGIIGIHAATDNFYDWPEGAEMMGGLFDGHPWNADGEWAVKIDEPDHPIAKPFGGKGFIIKDELYQLKEPYSRENLRVVISLDMTNDRNFQVGKKARIKREDLDFAQAWIRTYGPGRVAYSGFGHNNEIFWNKAMLAHFLACIQYALGDLEADATPSARLARKPVPALTTSFGAVESDHVAIRHYDYEKDSKILFRIESDIREASPKRLGEIEKALLESLEAPEATRAAKEFICRVLRTNGTTRSIPALERLLADKELSHMARHALQTMPSWRAGRALRRSLGTLEGAQLVGVIGSVAARQDTGAISDLRKLAGSEDRSVAEAALLALGRIGTSSAEKTLVRIEVPAALQDTRDTARLMCADALLKAGKRSRAADIYRELSGGGKATTTRMAAARGLAHAEPESAVVIILSLLKSLDPDMRALGGRLLAETSNEGALKAIAAQIPPALKPDSQVLALEGLRGRGDKSVQPEVARTAADDPDPEVRAAAVRALATVGDAQSVELLCELSVAPAPLGETALQSLAQISGDGVGAALLDVVKNHPDPEVRVNAILTLGARRDASALPVLLATASDENAKIRQSSHRMLSILAGENELPQMVDLFLKNRSASERDVLIEAIASTAARSSDKDRAVSVIAAGLSKSNDQTKPSLLGVLGRLGGEKAFQAVDKEFQTATGDVRRAAIRAMVSWPDPAPMKTLRKTAEGDADPINRILALQGFIRQIPMGSPGRHNKETVLLLCDAMQMATRVDEKRTILAILPDFSCEEALKLAKSSLEQKELAVEAQQAVSKIQDRLSSPQ